MSEQVDPKGIPESGLRAALRRPSVAIVGVMLLAALLRFWSLGHPAERVFDEVYYPKSACWLLGWSNERCGIDEEGLYDWVHPPLGKYSIALGELALGFDASDGLNSGDTLSYRLPGAIAGTLTVGLIALCSQLLFGAATWTWLAGTLMAVEGLSIVHSRVGMLDIFLTFWISLAFTCFLLDNRREGALGGKGVSEARLRGNLRPWRIASGVALGAAFATKWSGLMALAAIVVVGLWWDADRQRATGSARWLHDTLLKQGPSLFLTFVVIPLLIYTASYGAYFLQPGATFGRFLEGNVAMARFHATFVGDDEGCSGSSPANTSGSSCDEDITSRPWDWLLLRSPILYWEDPTPGHRAVILANGNPGIFWGAFASIPLALYMAIRKKDRTAALIATMFLALYLPWFAVQRIQYFFYAVPLAPFLVLAFVILVRELRRRGWPAVSNGIAIYAALIGAVMWPVYAGIPLSDTAWRVMQPLFPIWWGGL